MSEAATLARDSVRNVMSDGKGERRDMIAGYVCVRVNVCVKCAYAESGWPVWSLINSGKKRMDTEVKMMLASSNGYD